MKYWDTFDGRHTALNTSRREVKEKLYSLPVYYKAQGPCVHYIIKKYIYNYSLDHWIRNNTDKTEKSFVKRFYSDNMIDLHIQKL